MLMPMKKLSLYVGVFFAICAALALESCSDDGDDNMVAVHDVGTAEKVSVDRFSATAGHLMVRDATNGLPAANAVINFDQAPFITTGLGPSGEVVEYYNFDVQPIDPAPIYVLFRTGESSPVTGQLNIIDVLPGETNYNDFWIVNKVTVPAEYTANEVASYSEIVSRGYTIEETTMIVNCPVVPEGSTATKRLGGGSAGLMTGWYKEKIVSYFSFEERALVADAGRVPTSPIYVCFNINPADMGGGPASGFKVETGTEQTHNVVATIPASSTYSPLWAVDAYDNTDFDDVSDLTTAENATSVGMGLANVNCPVVDVQ
jgi:hypothetical protein